jgi:3-deoxy-D-manno-octulosonic-acid transferase
MGAARALYSAALIALTPAYLARLWWRGAREPGYRARLAERLGFFARAATPPRAAPLLWLHAVSLGETRAAAPLVAALRARWPQAALLITSSTATGAEAARALLRDGDVQAWLPYDTPGAVRRFLAHWRPAVGVLMETEVWPNLAHHARAAGVPLVLANARLSARSARRGERLGALMRPALAAITRVLAQTEDDAQRLRALGAQAVQVCGNLKFDVSPAPALLARGAAWRAALARAVVLAASTREGEDAPLLAAWRALPAPRPLLLWVPRHPQRFDEVAAAIERAGFTLARRSGWGDDAPPAQAHGADVWLGDSVGEMPLYAACAHAALLGGSYAPLGGQNLIELAACGTPVVMGPSTYNFAEAAELALAAGAAQRVADIDAGVRAAAALAASGERGAARERALAFAAAHRGATERIAARIAELVSAPAAR